MNDTTQEMAIPVSDGKGGMRYINPSREVSLSDTEIEILESAIAQDAEQKFNEKPQSTPEGTGPSAFRFKPVKRFSVKVLEDADARLMKKNDKLATENENLKRELEAIKKANQNYRKKEKLDEVSDSTGDSSESAIQSLREE